MKVTTQQRLLLTLVSGYRKESYLPEQIGNHLALQIIDHCFYWGPILIDVVIKSYRTRNKTSLATFHSRPESFVSFVTTCRRRAWVLKYGNCSCRTEIVSLFQWSLVSHSHRKRNQPCYFYINVRIFPLSWTRQKYIIHPSCVLYHVSKWCKILPVSLSLLGSATLTTLPCGISFPALFWPLAFLSFFYVLPRTLGPLLSRT